MHLKEKLKAGEKIYGIMIRMERSPGIVVIARNAGLDFLLYDCEHSCYGDETLHDLFVTHRMAGLPGLVRVPQLSKDYVSRFLDYGATGVMVPMVNTSAQAEELVTWSKYAPVGDRGYATGVAHLDFKGAAKHTEVMAEQNDRVVSIAQIETKEAVDNADAIAAVDGIDALLIGPNDLSLSLGIPGDLMNPIEIEAISHVAAACKKHGKAFGLHAGAPMLKHFIDDLTIVMCDTDIGIMEKGLAGMRKSLNS